MSYLLTQRPKEKDKRSHGLLDAGQPYKGDHSSDSFFFFFTPVNNKNLFQGDLLHEPFKRLAYIFLIRVPQVSNYLEVEK